MSELDRSEEASSALASDWLNESCYCVTLDRSALCQAFERETGDATFCAKLLETHPHLFSNVAVFISAEMFERMLAVVRAIEAAACLPAYREAVLSWAPEIARYDPGPVGAFMGYDFHLEVNEPKLIEINTNAGGAFLTAPLARAQRNCCRDAGQAQGHISADEFEAPTLEMFREEWFRQGRSGTPRRVAMSTTILRLSISLRNSSLRSAFSNSAGLPPSSPMAGVSPTTGARSHSTASRSNSSTTALSTSR